jgi:site-specific recombinase XerD
VVVLAALKEEQERDRKDGAKDGKDLVFRTWSGNPLSAGNVRRDFRKVLTRARLVAEDWTPRELRHSFVSLLSAHDIPIEDISQLVGQATPWSPRRSTGSSSAPSSRRVPPP